MNVAQFHAAIDHAGDCWEWQRASHRKGYGAVSFNGRMTYAHRVAWELENGPIPEGLSVLHHCDNPPCCRPSHLFLGTLLDNNRDMYEKGRHSHGERVTFSRLTDASVLEIRRRYAAGERQHLLASEFGVTRPTIHRVVHGHAWKHLLKESA